MSVNYAIITFRSTGPIKSWAELRGAQVHNLREKPIDHAVKDAPPPFVILGSNDLVGDVKKKLVQHGIDPNNLRENGVLAYEAVMTASPAFFTQWDEEERDKRLFEWVAAQMSFALDRYGKRVASMVLHRDEETPHVHAVIVPLQLVDDQRRKDRGWRWSLVGSSISGPGRFDQLQDAYAEAMGPFGLVRGERHSGRKNEPYRVTMARAAGREQAASEREVMALNAADASEQQRRIWVVLTETVAEQSEALDRKLADADAVAAEAERKRDRADSDIRTAAEQSAAAEAMRQQNIKRSNELLKGWEDLAEEERDLAKDRAEVRAEKAVIANVTARAAAFVQAFDAINPASLPPSIVSALRAAESLLPSPATPTSRYDATASARSVPLPVRQAAGMGI